MLRVGWGPWYQERKQSRLDIENDDYGEDCFHDDDVGFNQDDDDAGNDGCIGTSGPVMSGWCSLSQMRRQEAMMVMMVLAMMIALVCEDL